MLADFEAQVEAAGQTNQKPFLDCLTENILSENDLKNLEIKPVKKYLGPICAGTIGLIYGPRGVGKTFLRDALSLCLTRNLDFGPFKSENPAGVLICDGEMTVNTLKDRHSVLSQNLPEPLRPLDFLSNEYLYRTGNPIVNLNDQLFQNAFIELIKTRGDRWDVIFFDNLSSLMPGIRENDTDAWGPINSFFLKLRWLNKAVAFVHHAGKSGDQRGASGREDALDYVLKLALPAGYDPEAGCRFDASLTKSRSLIGPEAAPFSFEIINHPSGGLSWTVTNQRESKKQTIIALLGNGITQKSICEILGVDKAYVSRIRAAAIREKVLSGDGTFTAGGMLKYGSVEIEKYTG